MIERIHRESGPALVNVLDPSKYHYVAQDFLRANRIPLAGRANLQKLGQILQAFIQIPYENLSKILKYNRYHQDATSLRLPDEVWEDFRRHRLGGTCFSLTFLLQAILDYSGFRCYPVMARMKAGPNHHCALVVDQQNEHYLVDPGYAMDIPMAFGENRVRAYRSAHSGVEIRPDAQAGHYHVFTFNQEKVQWRYEFADVPTPMQDFLYHWLESFTWNGMHGLCLTRVHKDALVFIHKHFMRETSFRGKKNFNLKNNREQVIHQVFGIEPELVASAQAALEQNLRREWQEQKPRPARQE